MSEKPPEGPRKNLPKPFDIALVKESMNKGETYQLLDINYKDDVFTVNVGRFEESESRPSLPGVETPRNPEMQTYGTTIYIDNAEGLHLGRINGEVAFQGSTFVSFAETNLGYEDEAIPHVSGVVRKTISELIIWQVFKDWYSSSVLTESGRREYSVLSKWEGIDASVDFSYDGEKRIKLTKKS
jgi:hypothetical protein